MADTFDFSTISDLFEQLGYGGARTGADIVRMLGERRGTDISPAQQQEFGVDIQDLIATTTAGLGDLPGRLSELTGQVQRSFLGGRGGLERTALGQTQQFQSALARGGFAGAGALERGRETGRRAIGQQFTELLGRRRTGFETARTSVESQQASLLAALMGGIQNLRATLRGEGVFGEGDAEPPGRTLEDLWREYRDAGGTLNLPEWVNAGRPGVDVPGAVVPPGEPEPDEFDRPSWPGFPGL